MFVRALTGGDDEAAARYLSQHRVHRYHKEEWDPMGGTDAWERRVGDRPPKVAGLFPARTLNRHGVELQRTASPSSSRHSNAFSKMNGLPRVSQRLAPSSRSWTCFFCQHSRPQASRSMREAGPFRRAFNSAPKYQQQQQRQQQAHIPSMTRANAQYKKRNTTVAYE